MRRYGLLNNVLGWLVFVLASAVYLLTIEPSGSFWDCGEFISSAYKLEVGHPPGAPFFMLTANLFTQLASGPSQVAAMVNSMSAICSGLTILFLFWSITHLARKVVLSGAEKSQGMTLSQGLVILGSGLVGALAYTFSDTFWFSAVEGEVYAYSSLFTAVVFWLILKWEDVSEEAHADRWIVLIAYLTGLSIGVHLLNLLCIPAIVLVYYYKKFPTPTLKGTLLALLTSFVMVGLMLYGVVQGLVEVCGWFELLFVNGLGMPYNSGVFAYVIALGGVLCWAIYETMRTEVHASRLRLAFIISIALLGIPFIGSGYWLGILLIAALSIYLFKRKVVPVRTMNTILLSLMVIVVGYSSYALIMIRSSAGTPMDQNSPKDIFTLRTYLAREQYGQTPLLYGQTYVSEIKYVRKGNAYTPAYDNGEPTWSRIVKKTGKEKDRYYVSNRTHSYKRVEALNMLFPRMHSGSGNHVEAYKNWANVKGKPVRFDRHGETVTVMKPTFMENLRFLFAYQLNFMYWRYFMWNFSGRQNDIQGHGEVMHGNWITGIKFLDAPRVGPQDNMHTDISDNKGHNVYYMLPLLLGLVGICYQLSSGVKGKQGFWITFLLFFMTGIAIVLYLNQTPYQPRERDYAYAGSFYAFCIWLGFGVAGVARLLERYAKAPATLAAIAACVVCLLVPLQMAGQNWDDHDRSGRYTARDFGSNYLQSCAPNAILFTNGDNDTFPLWYAQEVEGVRTDVRVCNTSYLQTDWYIDQMKRQAYNSAPLPITWTRDQYIMGTRDAAYVIARTEQPIPLRTALEFIRSDDPRYKKVEGYSRSIDYIPSKKLSYKVDSAAVVNAGVLSPKYLPLMLSEMIIDLSSKHALGKQEITILDMLDTNHWQRPIYYAITVGSDQYVNLGEYFQQTGLAYRIVPFNARRSIDSESMYDNVMNKFKWGGVDKPGLYLDETVMRMCKTYRMSVFTPLARTLINEGQRDKALKVLDKAMEAISPANVPLDYTTLYIGDLYYRLGAKDKAEPLFAEMADRAVNNMEWFVRLQPHHFATVKDSAERELSVLQEVMRLGGANGAAYVKKHQEAFGKILAAYSALARS